MQHKQKPREQWDEDERYDGRRKTSEIQVLVVSPGKPPETRTIANTLDVMRAIVGGSICCFQTGIEGTIGVAHDEGILLGLPPCRFIEATGALIFGPFFIAGDGVNMHSLRPSQIAEGLRIFEPLLTVSQIFEALRREDETVRMIESWNNERSG